MRQGHHTVERDASCLFLLEVNVWSCSVQTNAHRLQFFCQDVSVEVWLRCVQDHEQQICAFTHCNDLSPSACKESQESQTHFLQAVTTCCLAQVLGPVERLMPAKQWCNEMWWPRQLWDHPESQSHFAKAVNQDPQDTLWDRHCSWCQQDWSCLGLLYPGSVDILYSGFSL